MDALELLLVAALQLLPPHQRAVLVLRDLEGFAATEVADLLGCTTALVDEVHRHARLSLAAALAEEGSADGVGGVVR